MKFGNDLYGIGTNKLKPGDLIQLRREALKQWGIEYQPCDRVGLVLENSVRQRHQEPFVYVMTGSGIFGRWPEEDCWIINETR